MGRLTRVSDWESILSKEIEKAKTCKFKYGKNDCTIWAANTIKAYTNLQWEPFWNNKHGALKVQRERPMEDRVFDVLGPPTGNILITQRGDLVQKDTGMNASLGICIGNKVVFLYKEGGICYADLTDCIYSWRI